MVSTHVFKKSLTFNYTVVLHSFASLLLTCVTNIVHVTFWISFICLFFIILMTCFQDLWVFCCCCYWCYFFMSCGVHVAKNYTNYILMVRFSSSLLLWEFSKIISFYPIVVDMSIHCSSIEQKNIEFLPRNLGAKLYCTLDILMTENIQSTTPRGSFALFKSLQWLWTSLVVQWLRLCFPKQGVWVWSLVRVSTCLLAKKKKSKYKTETLL